MGEDLKRLSLVYVSPGIDDFIYLSTLKSGTENVDYIMLSSSRGRVGVDDCQFKSIKKAESLPTCSI